ncbi:MAG: nucleotidyl transferase AbiEii/AbiGii toxin family protein [Kiritimatiellae bacterium]|jgi:hypothetical protein|nr:nucleotidyl transferase AbiEii/AbiGii toxin family protein [Kiritimatiellia bacterium]
MSKNIEASIRQKLLNHAKAEKISYDRVLKTYGIERLLYRLSVSAYRDRFVLKGAQLLRAWHEVDFRPTKDVDLLGFIPNQPADVVAVIREICATPVDFADGLSFDSDSVSGQFIQEDADYKGVRINMTAFLGTARIPLQMDIGFHDVVHPAPETVVYPSLLTFPVIELRGYTRESVIAEKVEAMLCLGEQNSRMKDF